MSAIAIDVADGFRDAWAANGTLNGLLPVSRVAFLKVPGTPTIPYAVFTIEPDSDAQYSTGSVTYIVNVVLRLSVYGTGIASSLSAIMTAVQAVYKSTFTISNTTLLATYLIDGGKVEIDGQQNSETVYRCDTGWRFMLSRNDG